MRGYSDIFDKHVYFDYFFFCRYNCGTTVNPAIGMTFLNNANPYIGMDIQIWSARKYV
jgi:hypothetical protein